MGYMFIQLRFKSPCAYGFDQNLHYLHEDTLVIKNVPGEDASQFAHLRSLIRIFAGHTCPKNTFSSIMAMLY